MANLYKVNSMAKRMKMLPTGDFQEMYEINFTTKSGVTSSVEIPVVKFTTDFARQQLENEARKIEDIMSL